MMDYSKIFKVNAILIAFFGFPFTFGLTGLFLPDKLSKGFYFLNLKIFIYQIVILEIIIMLVNIIFLFANKDKVLNILYYIEKSKPEYEKIVDHYFSNNVIVFFHILLIFYLVFIIFSILI